MRATVLVGVIQGCQGNAFIVSHPEFGNGGACISSRTSRELIVEKDFGLHPRCE
jgi:hypothetical protein